MIGVRRGCPCNKPRSSNNSRMSKERELHLSEEKRRVGLWGSMISKFWTSSEKAPLEECSEFKRRLSQGAISLWSRWKNKGWYKMDRSNMQWVKQLLCVNKYTRMFWDWNRLSRPPTICTWWWKYVSRVIWPNNWTNFNSLTSLLPVLLQRN